ncbi:glycosyltransferase family 2 protein, partial [Nesterenkonia sp. F]|uniref:glycosyltransferase family 2 protein n=1 Tax=Nesterenkonia sp. F TaxID=795955 RepID=UPI000255C800
MTLVGSLARPARRLARSARTALPSVVRRGNEPRDLPVDDVLEHWSRELRTRPGRLQWFTHYARGTRSRGAREVLALCASRETADLRRLARAVDQAFLGPDGRVDGTDQRDRLERLDRMLWRPGVLALARVLYSQRLGQQDLLTALRLYQLVDALHGVEDGFEGVDRSLYSDLLTWAGRFARAGEVLEHSEENAERACSQRFLQLNSINPAVTGVREDHPAWLERLNGIYTEHGLVGLELEDGQAPSFGALRAEPAPRVKEGLPLVSVIMPIHEPNAATDVALRSLLAQSWTNLEILIIDDASPVVFADGTPTPYRAQLQAFADADPRVQVLFREENRGAYAVRNEGFERARGEFVTIADKDDWHHPQKLERQARELMEHPDRPASIVNWVRADEDLRFLIRWGPDRAVHPSFASTMFRREEARSTLGYWDEVRKSADAEYRARCEAVYGMRVVPEEMVPMAISLLGEGNLTSSDFGLGYWHPDREMYQDAYAGWHEEIAAGASPHLPMGSDERRWIAPPSFLPDHDAAETPHYDVVHLSEFGLRGGNSLILEQEIEAGLAAGLRVAVVPLANGLLRDASKRRMTPALRRMVLDGRVDRLHLRRRATVGLLVVHWPTTLQLRPDGPSELDVDELVVVADQLPATLSRIHHGYEVEDVATTCQQLFGRRPRWAPQSSVVRGRLAEVVPPGELADVDWPGVAAPETTSARERKESRPSAEDERTPLVLGRPWDEEELSWPTSRAECEALLPQDGSAQVVLRADRQQLVRRGVLESAEALPVGWQVAEIGDTTFGEYLAAIDVLLCFTADVWDETLEPSILEALAAGVVCLGPPVLEEVYGDALICCEPG